VNLAGDFLGEVTHVFFGDAEATIGTLSDDGLLLETPANAPGPIDVTVEGGGGTMVLKDAFTYYPDQRDRYRGIGSFSLTYYDESLLNHDSVYGEVDGSFAQFEVLLHEPIERGATWWANQLEIGSCVPGAGLNFTTHSMGSYLGLEDLDSELGSFAMVQGGGDTYFMMNQINEDWTDLAFALDWTAETPDLPPMTVDVFTAPWPDALSLDYTRLESWTRGEDLELTFIDDPAFAGAEVAWYVANSGNTTLAADACGQDPAGGSLSLDWDTLMEGLDQTQAARIYLLVTWYTDDPITLSHDGSVFWSRGLTRIWFRLDLVDPT
jgi:hypothetical protein